jgi:hypothetical protein
MPAIKCICGNKINYGEIPNKNEFLIISDVEYDNFSGLIDSEKLYKKMKSILECKKCHRLYFFKNGFNNDPIIYFLDNYYSGN